TSRGKLGGECPNVNKLGVGRDKNISTGYLLKLPAACDAKSRPIRACCTTAGLAPQSKRREHEVQISWRQAAPWLTDSANPAQLFSSSFFEPKVSRHFLNINAAH